MKIFFFFLEVGLLTLLVPSLSLAERTVRLLQPKVEFCKSDFLNHNSWINSKALETYFTNNHFEVVSSAQLNALKQKTDILIVPIGLQARTALEAINLELKGHCPVMNKRPNKPVTADVYIKEISHFKRLYQSKAKKIVFLFVGLYLSKYELESYFVKCDLKNTNILEAKNQIDQMVIQMFSLKEALIYSPHLTTEFFKICTGQQSSSSDLHTRFENVVVPILL